jgi:HTH-type transcriptional regulator, transcriptional repressor of NAD biosynthesis genes
MRSGLLRLSEHKGDRIGLTLGKFAPLHRGHQYLIETARAETDRLILLIYSSPGLDTPPLPVRAAWVRDLYPDVECIEAWDGPTQVGDTPEIRRRHEAYLRRVLAGRRITHFFSSEFYGDHVSRAFGAIDRRVDPDRRRFPVSGTAVRADPCRHRRMIHPRVYRDLIINAVLLGGPSTGKTALAAALAERYGTVWMPEYGREYWHRHQVDHRLTSDQLTDLARGHIEREEALLAQASRVLFTDTNALTTVIYARYYGVEVTPALDALADRCAARYDLVFLCGDEIPFEDTPDRSGPGSREILQRRTIAELAVRKIPYIPLRGPVETRMERVAAVLSGFAKYDNPAGIIGRRPPGPRPDCR